MPPDRHRNEGTPSPSEGPNAGAKPFGYFLASEKVTRCKSETAIRPTRSNGYAPTPQEHGRPKGRQDPKPNPISYTKTRQIQLAPQPHPTTINPTPKKNPKTASSPTPNHPTHYKQEKTQTPAKTQTTGKPPRLKCPFDCHHGIANTHGNLMLPARNKE
jgi:hypothetical protein